MNRKSAINLVVVMALCLTLVDGCKGPQTGRPETIRYGAENGFIIGHNIDRYNNRPLYINNTNAFVLTGDRPLVRFARDSSLLGTFIVAVVRGDNAGKWLHECDDITSMYRSGRMVWKVGDASLSGLAITLDVLPMAGTTGFAVRASIDGAQKGDRLIWAYGGGVHFHEGQKRDRNWYYDATFDRGITTWGFTPDECSNTTIKAEGGRFTMAIADSDASHRGEIDVIGFCSQAGLSVGEASHWKDLPRFISSTSQTMPIARGFSELENGRPVYWAVEEVSGSASGERASNPERAFADGAMRTDKFLERMKVSSPDSCLNALAGSVAAAIDGRWYPPRFVHGPMAWNIPYVGWRSTFGPIMLGWHDRVQTQAAYYIGYQVKKSNKRQAKADPNFMFAIQDATSRFNGVGSIQKDQYAHTYEHLEGNIYNMQTQFFDQLIEEWRFTADPELEKLLRPALELQLLWEQECFDPDGDGVYESYINSWPTDSQWYNGGGTAEETAYAYRAHTAARDMARRAGDTASVVRHEQKLAKIKQGFFSELWIAHKGHSGAYREQGGHERLHENPWLYSIFLPIDAQLTTPLQALESVYYSEYALQNDPMPLGGRGVWCSNWWAPSQWSLRSLYSGDNFHLALSYFQAGLPEDGWDIMRGNFMTSAFGDVVPGNLGTLGGTDFADCADMFARVLVQGLFGYNPDYPNDVVKIKPQFPNEWDHASIESPDVKMAFKRSGRTSRYSVELAKAGKLDFFIPIAAEEVKSVSVDGKPHQGWKLMPGAGRAILQLRLPESSKATVDIETGGELPRYPPVTLRGSIGDAVELVAEDARIHALEDPQQVLENVILAGDRVKATLGKNKGYHTVVASVFAGDAPQWRIYRIRVDDPTADAREKERFLDAVPANPSWTTVDMAGQLNADVRAIYKQKYLSPRPNTVSARLCSDGYSSWCFPFWKLTVPEIKLDSISIVNGILVTSQKVPFVWPGTEKNIAFTSMWDNFPARITFPVNKGGEAIWFLLAGSTNSMQTQIANAVLRLQYADGIADSLELVPPINYWTLCPFMGTNYDLKTDAFLLPEKLPETVQLGQNCRAMLLNLKLRKGVDVKSVTLETLSQEVVVGLMGMTIMQ